MTRISFVLAIVFCSGMAAAQQLTGATPAGSSGTQNLKANAEQKTQQNMAQDLKQGVTLAEATLAPKSGSQVMGTVLFNRQGDGLHVVASITGATPGPHGIHIHEKGDCSAADASSAGGHFNPTSGTHAGPSDPARHLGDLGNITVNQDGRGYLTVDIPAVKGLSNWDSILGKSLVVHAKPDDLKTQPSGNSGDRIACGVIGPAAAKGENAKQTQKPAKNR